MLIETVHYTTDFMESVLADLLEQLTIAPTDLGPRLKRVYQVDPAEGGRQLATPVEETYDLVDRHLPTVDVGRLPRVFRYHRSVWNEAPTGLI